MRVWPRLGTVSTAIVWLTALTVAPLAAAQPPPGPGPQAAKPAQAGPATQPADDRVDHKADFLRLCDRFVSQFARRRRWPAQFFVQSYIVRSLCVAYDITREAKYLDACRAWSDQMLAHQARMIPPGAYYMNYGRRPGQDKGEWFVADASCIAMAVVATAARCPNEADRKRYLDSARAFADLTVARFVRESGGVTDGHWSKSDKEWWCSTALFASLAFILHDQTGEESYKQVALAATDWVLRFDYRKATTPTFNRQGAPSVLFYTLEAYSAGLPYLDGERRGKALAKYGEGVDWIVRNVAGEDLSAYKGNWGAKIGGLPFHLVTYARHAPQPKREPVEAAADTIFRFLATHAVKGGDFQRSAFAAISFAEKVSPGAVYHRKRKYPSPG